jgi:hypothetical protein
MGENELGIDFWYTTYEYSSICTLLLPPRKAMTDFGKRCRRRDEPHDRSMKQERASCSWN